MLLKMLGISMEAQMFLLKNYKFIALGLFLNLTIGYGNASEPVTEKNKKEPSGIYQGYTSDSISTSDNRVVITNPTYFCVHKERTNAILKLITNYANAFVQEDIEALKQFFSSDCQEVIKSQAKIFKGREEVISHIRDILLKTNKNHYKITNFEIKDPCTIFQGSQAIVTFTGIETYSGKSSYKLSTHITAILSKEDDKQELSLKAPVIPLKITATYSKESSKSEANPTNFSDYKCILFQMDGWKPYHPKK